MLLMSSFMVRQSKQSGQDYTDWVPYEATTKQQTTTIYLVTEL